MVAWISVNGRPCHLLNRSPSFHKFKNACNDFGDTHRSLASGLLAWAEVLDALGWNVALQLPGKSPMLGKGAREWLAERADEAVTWEKITGLLAAKPPASLLICTPDPPHRFSRISRKRASTHHPMHRSGPGIKVACDAPDSQPCSTQFYQTWVD
jgi:hypothetical protein